MERSGSFANLGGSGSPPSVLDFHAKNNQVNKPATDKKNAAESYNDQICQKLKAARTPDEIKVEFDRYLATGLHPGEDDDLLSPAGLALEQFTRVTWQQYSHDINAMIAAAKNARKRR